MKRKIKKNWLIIVRFLCFFGLHSWYVETFGYYGINQRYTCKKCGKIQWSK